jgi:hypothetical protein
MANLSPQTVGDLVWRGFSPDTPEEEARRVFRIRYGREPEYVGFSKGNVLAGPVSDLEVRREA